MQFFAVMCLSDQCRDTLNRGHTEMKITAQSLPSPGSRSQRTPFIPQPASESRRVNICADCFFLFKVSHYIRSFCHLPFVPLTRTALTGPKAFSFTCTSLNYSIFTMGNWGTPLPQQSEHDPIRSVMTHDVSGSRTVVVESAKCVTHKYPDMALSVMSRGSPSLVSLQVALW